MSITISKFTKEKFKIRTTSVFGENVRSYAQQQFCVCSKHKQKEEQTDNTTGQGFRKSTDLIAKVSSENAKSPAVKFLTKRFLNIILKRLLSLFYIYFSEWSQFSDDLLHYDIFCNLNDQAKWQATMLVNIRLTKTLNKGINCYIGLSKYSELVSQYSFMK